MLFQHPCLHQSVFCKSPEKALRIHQTVFWCEEGHCRPLRLTFCQNAIPERPPHECRGVDVSELCFDKMSNEGFYNVLSRTKIRFGGFRGILRRFAKYTLLLCGKLFFLFAKVASGSAVPCCSSFLNTPLFITFRFVDTAHLLESETHFFLLPSSKDLTSGHETIVFGR